VRNFLEFERAFPDASVVVLDQNYRSTQTILDAANAVISNNLTRETEGPMDLARWRPNSSCVMWRTTSTTKAPGSPSEVVKLRREHGYRWGDVAVFYRTNAQSRAIEEELVRQGGAVPGLRRVTVL